MRTAFGLDLAGYSTGRSGFARADRDPGKEIRVTIYRDNIFCRKLMGCQPLADMVNQERAVVQACMAKGPLVVDVPIDLQGLPDVEPAHFAWELTRRPVDFAFSALAALADRIGSPTARFRHCLAGIRDGPEQLGQALWETYPAASLRLLHLKSTGYKRKAAVFEDDEWHQADGEDQPLADLLNGLGWLCERGQRVTDDELDAALCALTGVADDQARLEADALDVAIRARIAHKTKPDQRSQIRATPPRGFVLLTQLPLERVFLSVRQLRAPEETLTEVMA